MIKKIPKSKFIKKKLTPNFTIIYRESKERYVNFSIYGKPKFIGEMPTRKDIEISNEKFNPINLKFDIKKKCIVVFEENGEILPLNGIETEVAFNSLQVH